MSYVVGDAYLEAIIRGYTVDNKAINSCTQSMQRVGIAEW